MAFNGITFFTYAYIVVTVARVQVQVQSVELGSGSGMQQLSLVEYDVAETATVSVDSSLETTQMIGPTETTTVVNSITPSTTTTAVTVPPTSNALSTSSVSESQPSTAMTTMFTQLMTMSLELPAPGIKATGTQAMVELTPTPITTGSTSSTQRIISIGSMATTPVPSVTALPASTVSVTTATPSTTQEPTIMATPMSSEPTAESTLAAAETVPAATSPILPGIETNTLDALSSRIPSTLATPLLTPTPTLASSLSFSISQSSISTTVVLSTAVAGGPIEQTSSDDTPTDMATTSPESKADNNMTIIRVLLIVLSVIIFLIIVFVIFICILVGLICKHPKRKLTYSFIFLQFYRNFTAILGDYSVKDKILSNWELKDAPSRSGGIHLMKIRTLDDKLNNDNALKEEGAAQSEVGTRATENTYDLKDISDGRNTTATTFGVATSADETVASTPITFGAAERTLETVQASSFGIGETNEAVGVSVSEVRSKNEELSEVPGASTNPDNKTQV